MDNPFKRTTEPAGPTTANTGSFLPADYIDHRAASRASAFGLVLFVVVMVVVVGAFLVTNRRWKDIRDRQDTINTQYSQEAQKIDQLKKLETQRTQMMDKAEITSALIEKVPRSVLLAELISGMPHEVTLLELGLKSKRVDPPVAALPVSPKDSPKPKSLGAKPAAAAAAETKGDGKPEAPKVAPPKFQFTLTIVGVAAVNNDIAEYMSKLQACPLLSNVELQYIKETIINDVGMRRFEISAEIRHEADAHELKLEQRPLVGPDPIAVGKEDLHAKPPHNPVAGLVSLFGKSGKQGTPKKAPARDTASATDRKEGEK